jgi:hypothetical protein
MAKIVQLHTEEQPGITAFKQQVQGKVKDPFPYDRLMIHYRKEKDYAEELNVIKKAISIFREMYASAAEKSFKKHNQSKVKTLSKQLRQKMGLVDKKGNELYLPEPLPRWIKRQATVEEKIKKKPGSKKSAVKKSK